MAKVILVGGDAALMEGLAQTLLGFGHEVSYAASVREIATYNDNTPALAVVSATELADVVLTGGLPLSPGGALIIYSTTHGERPFLPTTLQRATLAHLVLPLERHRLLALVHSFDTRSKRNGRCAREERDEDSELHL